jgi:hypothetical protein
LLKRRAAWCVDPRDVDAIAALLAQLVQRKTDGQPTPRPDTAFVRRFERRYLTQQLASLFDSLGPVSR